MDIAELSEEPDRFDPCHVQVQLWDNVSGVQRTWKCLSEVPASLITVHFLLIILLLP